MENAGKACTAVFWKSSKARDHWGIEKKLNIGLRFGSFSLP